MKKILTLPKKYLAFFILAVAVVFTAGFQVTNLRASGNINGFGWADGTGWISLNCLTGGPGATDICSLSNYGLNYGTGGAVTGYAWSDNLGWIQFDGGCPAGTATNASHPCAARVLSTPTLQLRGFAKITNFFSPGSYCKNPSTAAGNNCGWSNPESAGYISLSSINDQDTAVAGFQEATSAPYGVGYENGALNGYGWNPLLGWIQFTGTPNAVTVLLEPADGTISTCTTTPVTLSWSSTNAVSCSGSWPGSTNLPTTGTATVVGAGNYTVTCVSSSGSGVTSNTVTITTTTDPSSCVTLAGDAVLCELDDTSSLLSWTTPVGASCVAGWDSSIVFSSPGPAVLSVSNTVGNNLWYMVCNGVATNTVLVQVDAANSTPTCMDPSTDPPTLSIDPNVMCMEFPFDYFNLTYDFEGTLSSTCSGSWGATGLPGDGGSVQMNTPSTTTNYTVTCDGMTSNQVTFTVYPLGSAACNNAGCTDPNATNYNAAAMVDDGSCVYTPPPVGCPDPTASNYDPDAPASNGTGSCLYNGNGKPIIEEF